MRAILVADTASRRSRTVRSPLAHELHRSKSGGDEKESEMIGSLCCEAVARGVTTVCLSVLFLGAVLVVACAEDDNGSSGSGGRSDFVDNGNGTITDKQTGLMWEKKENLDGVENYGNPSDADNWYSWSASGIAPDGTAFSDFLFRINSTCGGGGALVCSNDQKCSPNLCGLAGYRDWRLPEVKMDGGRKELETILLEGPCTTIPCTCSASPCIDDIFGPTQAGDYWSSITIAASPDRAWGVMFGEPMYFSGEKKNDVGNYVRAVRDASACRTKELEAGPLGGQSHAEAVCPGLCGGSSMHWTGHWWTTIPHQMSVCLCEEVC